MKKALSILIILTMLLCSACSSKKETDPVTDTVTNPVTDLVTDTVTDTESSSDATGNLDDTDTSAGDVTGDEEDSLSAAMSHLIDTYTWPTQTTDVALFDGRFKLADFDELSVIDYILGLSEDSKIYVTYEDKDGQYFSNFSEMYDLTTPTETRYAPAFFSSDVLVCSAMPHLTPYRYASEEVSMTYREMIDNNLWHLAFGTYCMQDNCADLHVFPSDVRISSSHESSEVFQYFLDAYGAPDYIYFDTDDGIINNLYYMRGDHFMEISRNFAEIYDIDLFGITFTQSNDPAYLYPQLTNPDDWRSAVYGCFAENPLAELNEGNHSLCFFDYETFVSTYLNK